MKRINWLLVLTALSVTCSAQEFRFSIKINTPRLQTADPALFKNLENQIIEFINNRRWTNDSYQEHERIQGNINLTITEELSATSFRADLDIQAIRPVFGTSYESILLNHSDKEVIFEFDESRPLIYSANTYTDNLSSVLAFYLYYVLGLDYDSFTLYGGDPFYQLAQDIINLLPPGLGADKNSGWSPQANGRNRYFMIENILSPKTRPYRKALYDYHRKGLDLMHQDPEESKIVIVEALRNVSTVYNDYPNAMIVQMFANAKSQEITDIFTIAGRDQKNEVYRIMTGIDPSNRNKYTPIRR